MSESPFRFGLERVRDVRVHAEKAAQETLAQSLMLRGTQLAALAEADATLAAARSSAVPDPVVASAVPVSGASLMARHAWVQRLERRRDQAITACDRAEAQVAGDRAKVLDAARRREALDKLRDRRRAEHALMAGRAEAARLDEIAGRQAARSVA